MSSDVLLTIEHLRERVQRILKCVINLHIEILVLESKVCQLIDDVHTFNVDLVEVRRLDALIRTLHNNFNGPTVCHEWPYPLVFKGTAIDEADVAYVLNIPATTTTSTATSAATPTTTTSAATTPTSTPTTTALNSNDSGNISANIGSNSKSNCTNINNNYNDNDTITNNTNTSINNKNNNNNNKSNDE